MTSPWARHQQIAAIWPEVEKYYHAHQSEDGVFGKMARTFKIHENTLRRKLKGTTPTEPPKEEPPKPVTIKLLNLEDLLTSGKYTESQILSLFADTIAHLWNEKKSLEEEVLLQQQHILKLEADLKSLAQSSNERRFTRLQLEKGKITRREN